MPSKSTIAPPTVDTDTVELKDMMASTPPPELELQDDIVKLSINGDEVAVRSLLDSGKVAAEWVDDEGLGPIHVTFSILLFSRLWRKVARKADSDSGQPSITVMLSASCY